MNLFADLRTLVLDSLIDLQSSGALPADLDFTNVAVEPPRDALHGDMSTNAAMVLAKAAKSNPRVIAEALAGKLIADDRVQIADVAGPGFLNFKLNPACWTAIIPAALSAGKNFGRSTLGQGKETNVEFVSANPTGPLHVGHTRGAVLAMHLPAFLILWATMSRENITLTMVVRRSMYCHARAICVIWKQTAKRSRSKMALIPVTTWSQLGSH